MPRIGVGGLIHETNTFSTISTPLESFLNADGFYPALREGPEVLKFGEGRFNISTSGFLARAKIEKFEILPLVWSGAEPSAPASVEVFDTLMDRLIRALEQNLPLDGLYLDLHGAMVYGHLQDGETEILRRVRQVIGDIPVVASLDLHGNIDPETFELATALVGYRTYPHVDAFEAGERSAELMAHLVSGGKLAGAFKQVPFLMPSTTQPTTRDPARGMYAFLEELEKLPGVRSVSLMEGFPPSDLPHTGPSIFAYADEAGIAEEAAGRLLGYILEHEPEFGTDLYPCDLAVEKAIRTSRQAAGPVILADIQDNAGGGSPSDSTWLLAELVRQKAGNAAIGLIHDPEAAVQAHRAGAGAELVLSVGGHSLTGHSPFTATYRVIQLHDGDFTGTGPMVKDRVINLGKMAHLLVDEVHVVVASVRMQALDQSQFRVVGIEPVRMNILALKSANHYRADFGPIASDIINVEAPSGIIEDPSKIPYTRLREGVRLKGLGPVFHRPIP